MACSIEWHTRDTLSVLELVVNFVMPLKPILGSNSIGFMAASYEILAYMLASSACQATTFARSSMVCQAAVLSKPLTILTFIQSQ
jgi:hypothetical protein